MITQTCTAVELLKAALCLLWIGWLYTHQKKFSNTWWWNCGSSNYGKTWNAGFALGTRCTNLAFTPFDTSNITVFLMKLGWGNIHGNVFSDTVFLKDTSIWIKGKMLIHFIYRPMWRKRWRHTWSCQNGYMWYVISVPVHQVHSK